MTTPAGGLSGEEAKRRLAEQGPNEIDREKGASPWAILAAQFKGAMIWLLLGACVVSAVLGEVADAIAIGAIVVLNALVGFFQEYRAERAVQALRSMTAPRARVLRDGASVMIPATDVVVGDALVLEAGDIVPADARLRQADALRVNEAPLTGESAPVQKRIAPVAADAHLAERTDCVFMGTSVSAGTGSAEVIATGMGTELGKIAHLLAAVKQEATPLQRRLESVGKTLLYLCLGIVALVAILGFLRGLPRMEILLSAVSLAVAAVPEGLAAVVTIALALGVQRMASRHVLIRKLPSVETLGCATVICTDKTGTLTTGVMVVRELWGSDHNALLFAAAACSDAELAADGRSGTGDPTELALLMAASRRGIDRKVIESERPRVEVVPFDADTKRMSIRRGDGKLYVKGAVEVVLPACASGTGNAEEANTGMARQGLRVLAVATGEGPGEANLKLLGLVGIADPPRTEAIAAVALARAAGIKTVMITGDHPATAEAIGRELGILTPADDPAKVVHARATPEDKIRIVREWKARGDVVAMTGDGVNDAPALREAHIGIAMGRTGTEVTREASDMILTDDNFASIVAAVQEGRGIYDNIQKTLVYLLAGNVGELTVMLGASVAGLPLPLVPLQLLWINLVTDGLPALALVGDPISDGLLRRPPRKSDEPMLGRPQWTTVVVTGLLQAAVTLSVYVWALDARGLAEARNLAFSVIVFSELFRAFAARSTTRLFWEVGVFTNLRLLGVVVVSGLVQLGLHHIPFAQTLLGTGPLSAADCVLSVALGLIPFSILECWKLVRRIGHARSGAQPSAPVPIVPKALPVALPPQPSAPAAPVPKATPIAPAAAHGPAAPAIDGQEGHVMSHTQERSARTVIGDGKGRSEDGGRSVKEGAMKTSVIEVSDLLTALGAHGVEKRIGEVPGVESATVDEAAGSATVRYDETRVDIADIKSAIHRSGSETVRELRPNDRSDHKPVHERALVPTRTAAPAPSASGAAAPEAPSGGTATPVPARVPGAGVGHEGHAAAGAPPTPPAPAVPKAPAKPAASPPPAEPPSHPDGPVAVPVPEVDGSKSQVVSGEQPSTPVSATPTSAPDAPVGGPGPPSAQAAAAGIGHKGHPAPGAQPAVAADMAHEMGHGDKDLPAMVRDMRNRFWICLAFTVPIFVYAPMGSFFKPPAPPFGLDLNLWLFFFASAAILYPSWPFLVSAWRALRKGTLGMAALIALSVGTGYLFSVGTTFFFKGGGQFFEAASVLLVFILLGHWLEMRARAGASSAIKALMNLTPAKASVIRDGAEVEVPTAEVLAGEIVVIRPGSRIPVDGTVETGESLVDESMLTGESMPVQKGPGATVIGATINKSGSFRYKATKVGADSALAQIVKLVQEAQNSKAPAQLLADKAAQWLVIAAIVIGLATFAVWFWWIGQPLLFAVTMTITVFVIACPDALGLATPMAVMVSTGLGALNGILFKNASALEDATKLDVIVFDKTGTLTVGQPEVVEIVTADGITEDVVLTAASAVEQGSDHPLAQAILRRAENLTVAAPTGFESLDGMGARAETAGGTVFLGNRLLMETQKLALGRLEAEAARLQGDGRTVVHVSQAARVIGLIAIADAIRPTSKAAVAKLREGGIEVVMLTGDNATTAKRIAADLGIDSVLADVLPAQKAEKVKELQATGKRVGMVGDGVNDAPALTQANVGFAIGAGTDVAMESADVVLMKSDPYDIVAAIELSRATLRKMHQNLWWAVGYNAIAFPLAAGVLYPFVLSPEVAALSMSGSTLLVAANALMLKRTKLAGIRQPGKAPALGTPDLEKATPPKASAAPSTAALPKAEPSKPAAAPPSPRPDPKAGA